MLANSPRLAEDIVRRVLGLLDAEDPSGTLSQTLRSLAAHGFNRTAAATALPAHRNTLLYRINRIEKLTGLDLDRHAHRELAGWPWSGGTPWAAMFRPGTSESRRGCADGPALGKRSGRGYRTHACTAHSRHREFSCCSWSLLCTTAGGIVGATHSARGGRLIAAGQIARVSARTTAAATKGMPT
ncbi:hypothetical protein E4K10_42110 [Streptomyces sp. T1317-0309]|nr:hypothetical protein E4K10_42110 [Streptomyces sp. T1317-0309]